MGEPVEPVKPVIDTKEAIVASPVEDDPPTSDTEGKRPPPLVAKLFAVFLIACISFGSRWSSGVTGAMKSTIKKVVTVLIVCNS